MRSKFLLYARTRGRAWLPALLACLIVPTARAMDLAQMRAIAGIGMIEARVNEVIDRYGQPLKILPSGRAGQGAAANTANTALPPGDWAVLYAPAPDNAASEDTLRLSDFSRVVLYARDGIGRVTVRRKPLKTTYDVPDDPFLAHEVISVRAELRRPIATATLIKHFGDKYEDIRDADGNRRLRYWVSQREGEMPLRLYAVDFGLNRLGDRATVCVVNGPKVDFVSEALVSQHRIWERNMYD